MKRNGLVVHGAQGALELLGLLSHRRNLGPKLALLVLQDQLVVAKGFEIEALSFNAISNYDDSYGADYTRVVSCNTTGLTRTLSTIDPIADIKKVRAVMVRRGSDPSEIKKGPINSIVPNPPKVPSHHGPDVKTVMKGIDVTTMALLVPTTLMHQHNIMVEINNDVETEDVVEALEKRSRVIVVSAEEGLGSTAELMEYAKEFGRNRNDLYEIPVWKESIEDRKSVVRERV